MQILAFDTSTEYCSVALWRDGETVTDGCNAGQTHSTLLLPMIDRMLAAAELHIAQLDGIAFGRGPGSFTGLRIACGVAQGLAFAAGLPVAGIVTLEAMAEASGHDKVIACLDARMGEVYYAAYERQGDAWHALTAPSLAHPERLPPLPGEGWFACGNGFSAHSDALTGHFAGQFCGVDAALFPHAREIARLGAAVIRHGEGLDAAEAAPLYLRNKVAQTTQERLQA